MHPPSIAIYPTDRTLKSRALRLSQLLKLPLIEEESFQYDYLLLVTPHYLGLKKNGTTHPPLVVDFDSPQLQYRCKQLSIKKEALAIALGLKKNPTARIVDATGGLGQDSYVIAAFGFEVTIYERSPIIFTLLEDGLLRASKNEIIKKMHLIPGDAIRGIHKLDPKPHVIYLDPMFPNRKKTALPKKGMQIFHDIIKLMDDDGLLLETALACATERVVVKRPRLAVFLAGKVPTYSSNGKSCRFDVYIIT